MHTFQYARCKSVVYACTCVCLYMCKYTFSVKIYTLYNV